MYRYILLALADPYAAFSSILTNTLGNCRWASPMNIKRRGKPAATYPKEKTNGAVWNKCMHIQKHEVWFSVMLAANVLMFQL